ALGCGRATIRVMTMALFLGAFPVLPGKDDEARKFGQEVQGRGEEFSASQKRLDVTREEWSLQRTPMGSLVLVHFECPDPEAVFAEFATSNDPFDVWCRNRIKEITGVDLAEPSDEPPPE